MDFRFTDEEEAFRRELREFLQKEVPPEWHEKCLDAYTSEAAYDAMDAALDRQLKKKLGEKGWRTMGWPREYGGQGASPMKQLLYKEELVYNGARRGDDHGVETVGPTIILHGTEGQKEYHLPRIARGEVAWCQGYSEPGAGSDLASLQTRAEEDGDDYVINGQKIWTSFAQFADWMFLLARTDPDAPKHRGITFFLADMNQPGFTIRPIHEMAGGRSFNEVFFENVRVPKGNVLGEMNRGWYVAMSLLDFERSGIENPAGARRVLEQLVGYAKETKHNGRTLITDPVISAKLAEMAVEIEVARLLCYRVAWMQGQNLVPNTEASISKVFGTEMVLRLANTGMQILGLRGQVKQGSKWAPLQRFIEHSYLVSVSFTIGAGTSEIQRNIIATRGLGLPKGY